MLRSVVEGYPDADLSVHVVWVPMLGSDTEAAARDISKMFDDPRVHQYWDPKRLSGTSYSEHVYPTYLQDMQTNLEASLPEDHRWRQMKREWKNTKPANPPLWDIALTYEKGVRWNEHPPEPTGMLKQVFFYGASDDGPSGMFFTDFQKAPVDTDWIDGLSKAMTALMGKEPAVGGATDRAVGDLPGCAGPARGAIRAELLVLFVKELKNESTARKIETLLGKMKGVFRASGDAESKLFQVLTIDANAVTAERAVEQLLTAGYEAEEATPEQYNFVTSAMASEGAVVIRKNAMDEPTRPTPTDFPSTETGRIAKAFFESFNSGDSEAVRAFNEKHRAASALRDRTMSDRLEQYRSLFDDWGKLRVLEITDGGDRHISVAAQPEKLDQALRFNFEFEEQAPFKLDAIRIMMTAAPGIFPVPDRQSTGASNSDVKLTHLEDSLEPLREWFNAEKGKPRFIALLSPT